MNTDDLKKLDGEIKTLEPRLEKLHPIKDHDAYSEADRALERMRRLRSDATRESVLGDLEFAREEPKQVQPAAPVSSAPAFKHPARMSPRLKAGEKRKDFDWATVKATDDLQADWSALIRGFWGADAVAKSDDDLHDKIVTAGKLLGSDFDVRFSQAVFMAFAVRFAELEAQASAMMAFQALRRKQLEARIEELEKQPKLRYAGVWAAEVGNKAGEFVTWSGSMWYCNQDTTAKPGESEAWTLAVKRGRESKGVEPSDASLERVLSRLLQQSVKLNDGKVTLA